MIITLIGYRGVGKSTVAPRLAAACGLSWIDADIELERRAGRSIREIFHKDGEPEFRRLERELLQELYQRDGLVLAAGGGAMLNPATRGEAVAAGPVVWLTAQLDTLVARLEDDSQTAGRRPALTPQGGRAEIAQLLAAREPIYRSVATLIVPTDGRTADAIVAEIVRQLPAEGQQADPP